MSELKTTRYWDERLYFAECPECGALQEYGETPPNYGEQECDVCGKGFCIPRPDRKGGVCHD